jgi:hypothetical protein
MKASNISLIVIAISALIAGCATTSKPLTGSERQKFLSQSNNPINATLYLKCGRTITDSGPSPIDPSCTYVVNGIMYTKVDTGQVGRVEVPGGNITVDNSAYHTPDPVKTIYIPPGSSALLETDFYIQQTPPPYALLGVVGAVAHSVEQANLDKQTMNAPLTIFTKDFMSKVNGLQPVNVVAAPK